MSDNIVVQLRDGREVYLLDPEWASDGVTGVDPNTGFEITVRSSNIALVIHEVPGDVFDEYVAGDKELVTTTRWDEEGGA